MKRENLILFMLTAVMAVSGWVCHEVIDLKVGMAEIKATMREHINQTQKKIASNETYL